MKNIVIIFVLLILESCGHINLPFVTKDKPIVHSGHFLFSNLSKVKNEEALRTMENKNYSLVNLTLDDLLIARSQGINFENFPKLIFLNSNILDLQKDSLFSGTNIMSYYILNGVCFVGMSDNYYNVKLYSDNFLMEDPVLALLKIKNATKKDNPSSFVILHKPDKQFDEMLKRLPEDFSALLTN